MTTTRTPHDATTLISAARGLTPLRLGELWAFRELAGFFLWRDLKSRYKQMLLGPIWIMLQPLLNMIIFTIIFSYIAKLDSGNVPYPLYNYSSLLLWGFFSKCMLTTSGSLKQYKGLISKIYFPRFIVPVVG
ncbi:MAG: ABC transporter permease, partial [Verrucomicrobiota bacterium]